MTLKERDEQRAEMHEALKDIRRILLGNGKIGLVSQVLILWRGAMWTLGAAVVAVIGVVVNHFLL